MIRKNSSKWIISHLISTTEFIKTLCHPNIIIGKGNTRWKLTLNYVNFISQKPVLNMFVPCDENNKILNPPIKSDYIPYDARHFNTTTKYPPEQYKHDLDLYNQAQSKLMFVGFIPDARGIRNDPDNYYMRYDDISKYETIEELIPMYKLKLTDAALRHIGILF
jgi:hypothetical protein